MRARHKRQRVGIVPPVPFYLVATKAAPQVASDPAADHAATAAQLADPQGVAQHEWAGDLLEDDRDVTSPDDAYATFTGADGEPAWLDKTDDGTLTGWVRDSDGSTYRYSDVDAWAVDVDDAKMTRSGGKGDPNAEPAPEPDTQTVDGTDDTDPSGETPLVPDIEKKSYSLAVKHLPGQHDQRTHGHRFSHNPARLLIRGFGAALPALSQRGSVAPAIRPRAARGPRARSTTSPGSRDSSDRHRGERFAAGWRRPAPLTFDTLPDQVTPADLNRLDLTALTDTQVEALLARVGDNEQAVTAVLGEMDRRWPVQITENTADPAAEAAAMDDNNGWGVLTGPIRRRDPKIEARESYDLYCDSLYLRALNATNGNFFRRGVLNPPDETRLFDGSIPRTHLGKIASEELLAFFAQQGNRRYTWTEWLAAHTGWESLKKRTRATNSGSLSEFGG